MQFSVELTERDTDNAVVLAPKGRIDLATAEQFRERLIPLLDAARESKQSVIIDFSGVDYISSQGLRVLMVAAKQAKVDATNIAVTSLQPLVKEIFQITRFNHVLPCHGGVDEALAALSSTKA